MQAVTKYGWKERVTVINTPEQVNTPVIKRQQKSRVGRHHTCFTSPRGGFKRAAGRQKCASSNEERQIVAVVAWSPQQRSSSQLKRQTGHNPDPNQGKAAAGLRFGPRPKIDELISKQTPALPPARARSLRPGVRGLRCSIKQHYRGARPPTALIAHLRDRRKDEKARKVVGTRRVISGPFPGAARFFR